jgi:4-carboxymuconolactone decarboxylase
LGGPRIIQIEERTLPSLPPVDPNALSATQREIFNQIVQGPRGEVRGPFTVLLHSPGLAGKVEQIGGYIRFQSSLPARARELAICVVAEYWKVDTEWFAHAPLALGAGIPQNILDDLGIGKTPKFDNEADRVTYEYTREVLKVSGLSQSSFDAASKLFGTEALVDLTGLVGYYTLLGMVMNSFEVRPKNAAVPWRK